MTPQEMQEIKDYVYDTVKAAQDAFAKDVNDLNSKLDRMWPPLQRRVEFDEQTTESGIQLSGVTTVKRRGRLLGVTTLPAQPQPLILWTILMDDNVLKVVSGMVRLVD